MSEIDRPSYTAESLSRAIAEFERHYEMSSEAFYEAHQADTLPATMPRFDRHVWASFYEDALRLRQRDDVLDRVGRAFVTA
jgi:hypothetical protein